MLTTKGFTNDVGGVFGPDEGFGIGVPVVDVGLDMAYESGDGIEGAAPDGFSGKDSEPGFDHVEPGSAFGCEVQREVGVLYKPGLDGRSGMGRGVVQNDVKLPVVVEPIEPSKEAEEVRAVMGLRALTENPAGSDLESSEEASDSVSAVVMGLSCRQSWTDRQHRLSAAQGLDLSLLVKTEHDRIGRRVQIEANDVVDLLLGLGVGGELERAEAMGLKSMSLPDPMDRAARKARALRHVPRGPLGHAGAGRLESQGDDSRSLPSRDHGRTPRTWSVEQAGQSLLGEAAADAADLDDGVADAPGDLHTREPLRHQQHGLGPPRQACRGGRSLLQPLQLRASAGSQHDGSGLIGHGASTTMP